MVTVVPVKVAADEPVTGVQPIENPERNVSEAESMTKVTVGDAGTVIPAGKLTKIVEVSERLLTSEVRPTSHEAAIPAAVVVGSKVTDPNLVSLGCRTGEPLDGRPLFTAFGDFPLEFNGFLDDFDPCDLASRTDRASTPEAELGLPVAPARADGRTGVSTIVSANKKLTTRAVILNPANEPTREFRVLNES